MKRFTKFVITTTSIAVACAGIFYFLKNKMDHSVDNDFEDFDDDFEDFDTEEEEEENSSDTRAYVNVTINHTEENSEQEDSLKEEKETVQS